MPTNASTIVKRTLDLNNPPPLTAAQRERLAAAARLPDEKIDYSDAPFLPDAVWVKAQQPPIKNKKQISLRVDAEVLDFFKATGKRYQTRMNAVLRSYVDAARHAR